MKKVGLVSLLLSFFLSGCSFLPGQKAGLQVLTNDVPSSIYLNGEFADKTPFVDKELQPGEYTLKIQPDDTTLVAHETTVKLQAGLLTVVTWKPGQRPETSGGVVYEMEKTRQKQAELSIISVPDGAIISIDGQSKEFTPILIDGITPGQHEFEISLPSYETQRHTLNVIEGHRMNISVKLAKNAGVIISNPSQKTATPAAEVVVTATASTQIATSSATRVASAAATAKTVTILKTNYFVSGEEVLRVRDSAGNTGQEIGLAPVGTNYPYLGETTSGWHKITFKNLTGWVSAQYLKLE